MIDYFLRKNEIVLSHTNAQYIRKEYYDKLGTNDRLIALIGARGVGKTTLLLQFIQKNDYNALYVSGDDVEFTNTKLYGIVDEFYALGGRLLVVDEVHKYRNWSQEIKNIYDTFLDLKIIISGSSMLNILYEKFDLSRRVVSISMPPLSFREFLELKNGTTLQKYTLEEILHNAPAISKELVSGNKNIYKDFREYLRYGAYPFFLEGKESFWAKLNNAMEKIIYEDIPSINKIAFSHLSILEKLIYFVTMANKPYLVNIAALSRELKISEPTLYTYLNVLEKSTIFRPLKKVSKKRSKKPNKLLFANTNVLYAYANKLFMEPDIGVVRETFFVSCFREIYYRDRGDFVVDDVVFEIGGKNKGFGQIRDINNSYLAVDIDFTTHGKKIPLWLFGFLR
jgi:predicted AAA+ superfamily ATPase